MLLKQRANFVLRERAQLLVDIGSWGKVPGAPLRPKYLVENVIKRYIPRD